MYCINETLRLRPSVRLSTNQEITESGVTLGGCSILKGQVFTINIAYLHTNPDQWILPDKYIPERFDSQSQFYLTPEGKKRHPMSFGPFLGGKRVCLGKTFAESFTKSVLAVILSQLDFDFADDQTPLSNEGHGSTFLHLEPSVEMKIKLFDK